MSSLSNLLDGLRNLGAGNIAGLRPPYPPVVLELVRDEVVLVRLKRRGRGRPLLEAHQSRQLSDHSVPASLFDTVPAGADGLAGKFRELFEVSGTRPGRVSLVLPDNLAKIALLQLPERPASRRQLGEIVQAKMRRAVPFRLDEASLSYQLLAGEGRQVSVLVVVVRRAMVEHFERALEDAGARPGLVDISTPNLINLCRARLDKASRGEGDVALLNCTRNYFSLVILRDERVIFFRCKTFAPGDDLGASANGPLSREISNSFSYYREKLEGQGVRTVLVRSVALEPEQITPKLVALGCETVEKIDPTDYVEVGEGVALDPRMGQLLAPAIGAATGRKA